MNIGVVVSEFPKVTETFVLRNIKAFIQNNSAVTVFHLKPFRHQEKVHGFAEPIIKLGYYEPFFMSWMVLWSCLYTICVKPKKFFHVLSDIFKDSKGDLKTLVKTLAIIPKSLAYGYQAKQKGIEHIHAEFAGLPATTAWIISRIYSLPFSFSCHAHDIFISQAMLSVKSRDASFIRVISLYNRKFLIQHIPGIDADKIKVIRCGVAVDEMPDELTARDQHNTFTILYVGSLLERKGVDNLLMALSRLSSEEFDWCCSIIGDGSERQYLEKMTQGLGLSGRVTFLGSQTYEEIRKAYESADLAIVPSIVGPAGRCEGIPVVIMEALAFGLPTITTTVSGIPELIEENVTGYLFSPGDVEALADKIIWVHNNRDSANQVAVSGRKRVFKEYDVTANASQLLNTIIEYTPVSFSGGV